MPLYYREYGHPVAGYPSLLFLHGLFGSSINWNSIARHFEQDWHIIVPDLRNHGRSLHSDEMSYSLIAEDVIELIDQLGIEQVIPIGHSMGGKTALTLAQQRPEIVERLVLADIAPVAYAGGFSDVIAAFQSVDLASIKTRSDADQSMSAHIAEVAIRQYLLQNLEQKQGCWRWRINLDVIVSAMDTIRDFEPGCQISYEGESLIIRGEFSDYVLPEYEATIRQCLPNVRIKMLPGVGHWVYAEDPEGFSKVLDDFLG
jgi:esterase